MIEARGAGLEGSLYFTNIGLLAGVDAHVDGQLVLAGESFAADRALECLVGGCKSERLIDSNLCRSTLLLDFNSSAYITNFAKLLTILTL